MDSGIHWNPLESTGIHWNPLESTGIHWDPLESTGIHWNPLESTEIHFFPFEENRRTNPPISLNIIDVTSGFSQRRNLRRRRDSSHEVESSRIFFKK